LCKTNIKEKKSGIDGELFPDFLVFDPSLLGFPEKWRMKVEPYE
jgi:hypothetical protein